VARRAEARVKRRLGWRGALALGLAAVGVASVSEAARLHGKAHLGQLLIERAWQRIQQGEQGGEAARPWPWADTWPVARLQVPAHDVDVFVLAGGTGSTLAWGPGHLAGTARVGGPGNAVVGGHRDTHFAFLRDLDRGAVIRTEDTSGGVRIYRVVRSFVTHSYDTRVLAPTDEPRLTLVTCWPFDSPLPGGAHRYVVVAEPWDGAGEDAAPVRRSGAEVLSYVL